MAQAIAANKKHSRPAGPSRFADWIDQMTPKVIGEKLGVSKWTVIGWRDGALGKARGYRPDPSRMQDIIRLSGGALVVTDIYPKKVAK